MGLELSVVIPSLNERENLQRLLPELRRILSRVAPDHEVLVVDGGSTDGTRQAAEALGARVIEQRERGFGRALREGVRESRGEWVLTMDADGSHDPEYVRALWAAREAADIVVASRYVGRGATERPLGRKLLSSLLNRTAGWICAIPVQDSSGGFKLYRRSVFDAIELTHQDFSVQMEAIVKAVAHGFRIVEVPYTYKARRAGASHARVVAYGWSFLTTMFRTWSCRWGWVAVLVLAGVALRFARLDLHDYWMDESISVWEASQPDVLSTLRQDPNHPPLFAWLLSLWQGRANPVWHARLLPALFAGLTLLALIMIARRHFGVKGAKAAALIAAPSAVLVYYGQEVRPYCLVLLFSTLGFGAFLDLALGVVRGAAPWVAYFLSGALLAYSHYLGGLFLGACFLAGLLSPRLRHRTWTWVLLHLAIGAVFMPWLPCFVVGLRHYEEAGSVGGLSSWLLDLTIPYVAFSVGKSLVPSRAAPGFVLEASAVAAGVIAGATFAVSGLRRLWALGRDQVLAWMLIIVLPVAVFVAGQALHRLHFNYSRFRYVIFCCPPLLLLYAMGLASLWEAGRTRLAGTLAALYLCANLASLGNYFFNPDYLRAPAYREAARWLEAARSPGEPIVALHTWTLLPMWIQLAEPSPFYIVGTDREAFGPSRRVTSPDDLRLAPGQTFWTIDFRDWRARSPGYREPPPASWRVEHYPLVEQRTFRGLVLERLRRE